MKNKSLENVFNAYFNHKKDFSDFHKIRTEEEAYLILLKRNSTELYQCSDKLKTIHNLLACFVFSEMSIRKDIVFSYRKEVNITDAVRPHCEISYIYKTDISKIFPSISVDDVSEKLKQYYAHISMVDAEDVRENIGRIVYLCTLNNQLPVGFASSPYISNFCFYGYDNLIESYCREKNYIYSRYADDLIISL
jgi:hypothetical protein